jgi:hypothetical protein
MRCTNESYGALMHDAQMLLRDATLVARANPRTTIVLGTTTVLLLLVIAIVIVCASCCVIFACTRSRDVMKSCLWPILSTKRLREIEDEILDDRSDEENMRSSRGDRKERGRG